MDFNTMVKKQEEIEQLRKEKKALIERLNSCQSVIEIAAETIAEWFEDEDSRGDIYLDLIGELAPNEELLMKLKSINHEKNYKRINRSF